MASTIGFIADLAGWLKEDEFGDWGTIHLEDKAEDKYGNVKYVPMKKKEIK